MVFGLVAAAFLISTGDSPLDTALRRAEPPASLRASFTVELTDGESFRQVHFDPRLPADDARWKVVETKGDSSELDRAVTEWGLQDDPDGWLFADDLRASMGRIVEAEDMGAAWRINFQHLPSANDGPMDIWAAEHLTGYAWLEPVNAQLLRVDYHAPQPFDGPNGGKVETYDHAYLLQRDPEYGITFVSAYKVDVRGHFLSADIERAYRVRVTDVDFFFSSPVEEALFKAKRLEEDRKNSPLFMSSK